MLRGNADLARRLNVKLRARGIMNGDTKCYVSLAHDAADIAHTVTAWSGA